MNRNNFVKKSLLFFLCCLLVFSSMSVSVLASGRSDDGSFSVSASAATTIKGSIRSSVNLRQGPSTEFSVVVSLSAGDPVVVTGKCSSMLAVTVTHKGKSYSGYVLSSYVKCASVPDSMEIVNPPMPDQTGNPMVGKTLYVKDSARMHRFASGISEVVVTLSKNDACKVLASGFNWYQVSASHAGKTYKGFVCGDYLTQTKPAGSPAPAVVEKKTGYVNYDFLNVRSKATTASTKKDQLYKTQQVTILSSKNGWYKIQYIKGSTTKSGYVSAEYISVTSKGKMNLKAGVFKSASSKSTRLATLKKGTKVTLIKEAKGWVKIKISQNGILIKGYVKAKNIDV